MLDYSKKRTIDLQRKAGKRYTVPTPFSELNKRLRGGLRDGEFGVIMGTSGAGKSHTLLNFSLTAARCMADRAVYHFLLEMDLEETEERLVQSFFNLTVDEAHEKRHFIIPELPLLIIDSLEFENSIKGIEGFINAQSVRPGLITIDYAGLLNDVIGQDWQAWIQLSKSLEQLAKRLKCPIWTATQITQSIDFNQEKDLYDERHIASGKGFKNNARVYMSINRTKEQTQYNIATINPFKMRRGTTGAFDVYFDLGRSQVCDIKERGENAIHISNTKQDK